MRGGVWVRPWRLGGGGRACEAVVRALPAPRPGERQLVVVGTPGGALPDHVVDQLRAWLRQPVPPDQVPPVLLFAQQPSRQQLEWVQRRAARGGGIVVPPGGVRSGPAAARASGAGAPVVT